MNQSWGDARRVGRHLDAAYDEAYLDHVYGYHPTERYRKAMRRQQGAVELLFAEAKAWHGLRRVR
jgi:hypothetical protein